MTQMEATFNKRFEQWGISLPEGASEKRDVGRIVEGGWAIWYLFSEDDRGAYLDVYSSHRMTSDEHTRIYENETTERLPAIVSMRMVSKDPKEDSRWEAEYYAKNQEIAKMLDEKGFGLRGDEPGSISINRYLHVNKMDK